MGTQHANEVSNNARLVGKFGKSHTVFARRTLRRTHDVISWKSLDLRWTDSNVLKCRPKESKFPLEAGKAAKVFVPATQRNR